MPVVENDTDDTVELSVEEGQGTSGFTKLIALEKGAETTIEVTNAYFNIFIYPEGGGGEMLTCVRGIHRESRVRIYSPHKGEWALDVQPPKAA